MKSKNSFLILLSTLTLSACASNHTTLTNSSTVSQIEGTWHLQKINNKDARSARVTLNINTDNMTIDGFDGCNNIHGKLYNLEDNTTIVPQILSTRMACRTRMHKRVSQQLHNALEEGFTLVNSTYGNIDGSSLKSKTYTLFFTGIPKKEDNNTIISNDSNQSNFSLLNLFKNSDNNETNRSL